VCCTDVLSLAASLGDLTLDLRRARTALWCSLQLASSDLPLSCVDAARRAVNDKAQQKLDASPVSYETDEPASYQLPTLSAGESSGYELDLSEEFATYFSTQLHSVRRQYFPTVCSVDSSDDVDDVFTDMEECDRASIDNAIDSLE